MQQHASRKSSLRPVQNNRRTAPADALCYGLQYAIKKRQAKLDNYNIKLITNDALDTIKP